MGGFGVNWVGIWVGENQSHIEVLADGLPQ